MRKEEEHASPHGDDRYTFVHFGDGTTTLAWVSSALTGAATGSSALASYFMPSYDGSMCTAGVTFHF